MFLIEMAVLLFSLSVHESAHAWAADYLGDYTARYQGRISLNPLVHIDPVGTLLFPLIGLISGIPVMGWAKPVPVNPAHLRQPTRDNMIIAAAGPASNVVLALISLLILFVVKGTRPDIMMLIYRFGSHNSGAEFDIAAPLITMIYQGFWMNMGLAFFNLIPIPPLDGSKVLYGLLPYRAAEIFEGYSAFGFVLLYILMFTSGLSFVYLPAKYLYQLVLL